MVFFSPKLSSVKVGKNVILVISGFASSSYDHIRSLGIYSLQHLDGLSLQTEVFLVAIVSLNLGAPHKVKAKGFLPSSSLGIFT